MTNSECRVTYMPKLAEPPGEALPDWQIIAVLPRRWASVMPSHISRQKKYSPNTPG